MHYACVKPYKVKAFHTLRLSSAFNSILQNDVMSKLQVLFFFLKDSPPLQISDSKGTFFKQLISEHLPVDTKHVLNEKNICIRFNSPPLNSMKRLHFMYSLLPKTVPLTFCILSFLYGLLLSNYSTGHSE